MGLWSRIAGQFGRPTGNFGRLAGVIMANRSSNIERNAWTLSLLELKPSDQVLETGFGPGVAIRKMSEIVTDGIVCGIDHSAIMVEQASRRNRVAISQGRVKLLLASASDAAALGCSFDKILDINSFQFWDDPVESLLALKGVLREGGKIFLVHQPRKPGANEKDTDDAGAQFARCLEEAGFRNVVVLKKQMRPVPAVCIVGSK